MCLGGKEGAAAQLRNQGDLLHGSSGLRNEFWGRIVGQKTRVSFTQILVEILISVSQRTRTTVTELPCEFPNLTVHNNGLVHISWTCLKFHAPGLWVGGPDTPASWSLDILYLLCSGQSDHELSISHDAFVLSFLWEEAMRENWQQNRVLQLPGGSASVLLLAWLCSVTTKVPGYGYVAFTYTMYSVTLLCQFQSESSLLINVWFLWTMIQ